jgi:hypothetical protein
MRRAAPLILLAACRGGLPLDDEIRVVKSEVRHLEEEISTESPLWVPEFDKLMDDDTPDVPEVVYRHVVRKLWKMSDEEIQTQVVKGAKSRALRDDPGAHRGRFYRIVGRVSRVWVEDVAFSGFPRPRIYGGIMYVNDREPVLFHSLTQPELLYVKEDMIGFEGVFLKIVSHELSGGGELRAPFLVARALRKYH